MAWSGFFAPCFVNDYVIAEITYSTVHASHEVPAWPCATFCSVSTCKLHLESPCGCVVFGYVRTAATAVVPARREETCLQLLWLLAFSSSFFLAHVLSPLDSANRVHSEIQWDSCNLNVSFDPLLSNILYWFLPLESSFKPVVFRVESLDQKHPWELVTTAEIQANLRSVESETHQVKSKSCILSFPGDSDSHGSLRTTATDSAWKTHKIMAT